MKSKPAFCRRGHSAFRRTGSPKARPFEIVFFRNWLLGDDHIGVDIHIGMGAAIPGKLVEFIIHLSCCPLICFGPLRVKLAGYRSKRPVRRCCRQPSAGDNQVWVRTP